MKVESIFYIIIICFLTFTTRKNITMSVAKKDYKELLLSP
jgi:hypothetical protein